MNWLLELDERIFLFLNNLGQEVWDPFWMFMSSTKSWIPLYVVLLFIIYRKYNLKSFGIAFLLLLVNVVLTDTGSVWIFKEQVQRLRPCHVEYLLENMRLVKGSCGGQYGFVSSHASNTFGLAVLIGGILKPFYRYPLAILIFWAVAIAFSRIYLGVHYPLDVICGAVYGAICGYIVLKIFNKFKSQ